VGSSVVVSNLLARNGSRNFAIELSVVGRIEGTNKGRATI